jgi:hypothetical protein
MIVLLKSLLAVKTKTNLGWYQKNESKTTLESILQVEIDAKSSTAKGSATDALLWLKRGLWMMAKYMRSIIDGNLFPKNLTSGLTGSENIF